jgi:hypothetical protein
MNASNATTDYMLFFRGPDWDAGMSREEIQQMFDRLTAWMEGLDRLGKVKGGLPLDRTGRVVSRQKGQAVIDGPFAESKEGIGGYLLVEVADLEEAVEMARSCPTLEHGITIEVRPVGSECPISKRLREQAAPALV